MTETYSKKIDFSVLESEKNGKKEPGEIRFIQLLRKISKRKKGGLFTRQSLIEILLINGLSTEEMAEKHLETVLEMIVTIPSFFYHTYTLFPVMDDNELKYKIKRYTFELFLAKKAFKNEKL